MDRNTIFEKPDFYKVVSMYLYFVDILVSGKMYEFFIEVEDRIFGNLEVNNDVG